MKITKIISGLLLGVLISGCNVPEESIINKSGFNLTTLNGKQLAPSIAYIQQCVSKRASEKAGYDVVAVITSIEHLKGTSDVFFSRISYETSEGYQGTELWTNGILGKNNTLTAPNSPKSRLEYVKDPNKTYTVICNYEVDNCQKCPSPTESVNGNIATVTCGLCEDGDGPCNPYVSEN